MMLHSRSGQFLAFFFLWTGFCSWLACPALAQRPTNTTPVAWQPQSDEHVVSAYLRQQELVIFAQRADTRHGQSVLKAYGFDVRTGRERWRRGLDSVKVGKWGSNPDKALVAESFTNAVASGVRGAVPPAYQYFVYPSADGEQVLTYIYDYSGRSLSARACVFDAKWGTKYQGSVPLDRGTTNYGLYLHRGEIFVLNSNEAGDIQLNVYNISTGERSLLEVSGSSAPRNRFTLTFANNEAWVLNTIHSAREMTGLMFSRFNLMQKRTEQVQYVPLPATAKNALFTGSESPWAYDLTGCRVNNRKEISWELEGRQILSSGFQYKSNTVNDPLNWRPRKAMVHLRNQVALTYDTLGVLLDEQLTKRDEKVEAEEFLENISWVVQPIPGLPVSLVTERQFIRLERKGKEYVLNTYTQE